MYHNATVFDRVVPRLPAGETVIRADIARLGHGGFCVGCKPCRFPEWGLGKG